MSNRTFVIGVGMTKFDKPGTKAGDYPDWAREAGENGSLGVRDKDRTPSSMSTLGVYKRVEAWTGAAR